MSLMDRAKEALAKGSQGVQKSLGLRTEQETENQGLLRNLQSSVSEAVTLVRSPQPPERSGRAAPGAPCTQRPPDRAAPSPDLAVRLVTLLAMLLRTSLCFGSQTWQQRLMGFAACAGLGLLCFLIGAWARACGWL